MNPTATPNRTGTGPSSTAGQPAHSLPDLGSVSLTANSFNGLPTGPQSQLEARLLEQLATVQQEANKLNGVYQLNISSWSEMLVAIHLLQRAPSQGERSVIFHVAEGHEEKRELLFTMHSRPMSEMIADISQRALASNECTQGELSSILRSLGIASDDASGLEVKPLIDLRSSAPWPVEDQGGANVLTPTSQPVMLNALEHLAQPTGAREMIIALDSHTITRIQDSLLPLLLDLGRNQLGLTPDALSHGIKFLVPRSVSPTGATLSWEELERLVGRRRASTPTPPPSGGSNQALEQQVTAIKQDPTALQAIISQYPGFKVGRVVRSAPANPERGQGAYCWVDAGDGEQSVLVEPRGGGQPTPQNRTGYILDISCQRQAVPDVGSGTAELVPSRGNGLPPTNTEVVFSRLAVQPYTNPSRRARPDGSPPPQLRMYIEEFCDLDQFLRAHLESQATSRP